jgi:integrase/recombinase XerD
VSQTNWTPYWIEKLRVAVKARGFSDQTFNNYKQGVSLFLERYPYPPKYIKPKSFPDHFVYLVEVKKLAESTVNLHREGLRFFYRDVVRIEDPLKSIPRIKEPHKLPKVLSIEDVRRLISKTRNPKHRLILSVAYSGGLRLAEIVNLKPGDIDFDREVIWIREGKGRKDRVIMLSSTLKSELIHYLSLVRPVSFLFESEKGGALCRRSIQAVFEQACARARIEGRVGIHSLRHSFATHLLESGTDLRYIQALLGHQSSKTTEIYTHVATHKVAKIVSPFDRLGL